MLIMLSIPSANMPDDAQVYLPKLSFLWGNPDPSIMLLIIILSQHESMLNMTS